MTPVTDLMMAGGGFEYTTVAGDSSPNLPPAAFDYGNIPADTVAKLRGIAATIRRTLGSATNASAA
jgi:hypothetical protein